MIIILSISYERSTDEVIDYFLYNKKQFLRINGDELKDTENFKLTCNFNSKESHIEYKKKKINLSIPKIIWYRRITRKTYIDDFLDDKFDFHNSRLFSQYVFKEWDSFLNFFVKILSTKTKWLDYPNFKHDKLDVLDLAKKNGLNIPLTFISNNFEDIDYSKFITKPLSGTTSFKYNDKFYAIYTSLVKKTKAKFTPSLIQQEIKKDFEIRSFYLDGKFYSMAIFSQNDNQTKIDFRKYNYKKPNRTVPYRLPIEIEKKLHNLMIDLSLKTGSFDLIKSLDGNYYFLEVNPVGQFGMVSKPCNYFLEEKIYEKLTEYEKNL